MDLLRKNTHWIVIGTRFQFEIINLWGKGFKNNYEVTAYELKYTHRVEIQVKTAAELQELLKNEVIKRI